MTTNQVEELYPEGLCTELYGLPDDDIRKIIARAVYAQLAGDFSEAHPRDAIEDVRFTDDPRVVDVSTCGHGYTALGKPVRRGNQIFPIGTIIGEEDGGVDPVWVQALGWKSRYGKNVEPSGDY